jgi:hypothetical protein
MNLSDWRKQREGEEFTLPSGLDVTLRKVSVMDLAQSGSVPETLRPTVGEMLARGKDLKVSLEELQQFGQVVDLVAQSCLVKPEGLEVKELPWTDRQAIFTWANAPAAALTPFRREQESAVEAPLVSDKLRAKT